MGCLPANHLFAFTHGEVLRHLYVEKVNVMHVAQVFRLEAILKTTKLAHQMARGYQPANTTQVTVIALKGHGDLFAWQILFLNQTVQLQAGTEQVRSCCRVSLSRSWRDLRPKLRRDL